MPRIVVDASVAAEWFLPEPDSAQARSLLGNVGLIAPDWLLVVVAHALDRRRQAGEITLSDCRDVVLLLRQLLRFYPAQELVGRAQELANSASLTVHDAIHVALAEQQEATVVTADRRLAAAPSAVLLSLVAAT